MVFAKKEAVRVRARVSERETERVNERKSETLFINIPNVLCKSFLKMHEPIEVKTNPSAIAAQRRKKYPSKNEISAEVEATKFTSLLCLSFHV